jgi:DHA1 family tetracycline resistance protein-like MFS transporter
VLLPPRWLLPGCTTLWYTVAFLDLPSAADNILMKLKSRNKSPATTSGRSEGKRSPLAVVLLTVFVDLVGFGIVVPLLAFYAKAFGGDATALGLLVASFFLMQFLFAPVLGRLSDRFGRRPVLLASLVGTAAAYVLLGFATSLAMVFAARILAGIASANLVVAQAYVADSTRPEARAKGMGLIGAAFGVGFSVGPVIGSVLVGFGLAAPAFVAAAIASANLLLALVFLPESLPFERRRANGRTAKSVPVARSSSHGLLGLWVAFFLVNFAYAGVSVMYPLWGIGALGLDARQLSLVFLYVGVITVVMGGLAGKLAKRVGEERLVAVGAALMATAFLATPWAPNLWVFVLLTGALAIGIGTALPLVPALVSKRIPEAQQGRVLGLTQAAGSLGRVPGPFFAGLAAEVLGLGAPFVFAGVLMAAGSLLLVRLYQESSRATRTAAEPSPVE